MSRAPVVLIVSEHEWASRSLDTVLAPRGYAVMRAYNGEQALERAAAANPDAVFLEHNLPDTTGAELCRAMVASDALSASAPIFVTTSGPITQDQRLEALRAGAWEVVSLPMDAEELLLRLDRYTRAKLEADRLQAEAIIDGETGLYSRAGLLRRAREIAAGAERYGRPMAFIVYDAVGDEECELTRDIVAQAANLLRSSTRKSDIVGRIGPCQFAIVAPDTHEEGAQIVARRLRERATTDAAPPTGSGPRAGVFAVHDLQATRIDPAELMMSAIRASRGPESPGLN